MKKIILCAALMVAVSLIGIGSIMAQRKKFTPVEKYPKKIERVPTPQVFEPPSVRFGEPNETAGSARLLGVGTYHAALSREDDVDYYKFKAPPLGFGSWLKIEFQSRDPRTFNLEVEVTGPGGDNDYLKQPSGSLWIALKSGVEAKIKVVRDDPWRDLARVYYDITLTSQVIRDTLEDDDTKARAHSITYGGSETAYMCGVLDSTGETVGLDDWFIYDHIAGVNDCVISSRAALLQFCQSPAPGDCQGCEGGENVGVTRYCLDTGEGAECEGEEWMYSSGPRYIRVSYPGGETYHCSGTGDVPSHYRSPYTIRLVR